MPLTQSSSNICQLSVSCLQDPPVPANAVPRKHCERKSSTAGPPSSCRVHLVCDIDNHNLRPILSVIWIRVYCSIIILCSVHRSIDLPPPDPGCVTPECAGSDSAQVLHPRFGTPQHSEPRLATTLSLGTSIPWHTLADLPVVVGSALGLVNDTLSKLGLDTLVNPANGEGRPADDTVQEHHHPELFPAESGSTGQRQEDLDCPERFLYDFDPNEFTISDEALEAFQFLTPIEATFGISYDQHSM